MKHINAGFDGFRFNIAPYDHLNSTKTYNYFVFDAENIKIESITQFRRAETERNKQFAQANFETIRNKLFEKIRSQHLKARSNNYHLETGIIAIDPKINQVIPNHHYTDKSPHPRG